jgi:hypothetical protein
MAAFAGCSSQATDTTDQAAERELSIAFDGLGRYEEKVRNAEPLEEASLEVTTDDVHQMLEETDSVEEEAEQIAYFAEQVNDEDLHSILQEYHLEKTSTENQVVINQNTHIGGRTGNVNEIYTVKNNQLQSQPILQTDLLVQTERGDTIHKPGQQQPQELKAQRNPENSVRFVPQDYNSIREQIVEGVENEGATNEQVQEFRNNYLQDWSEVMFGTDSEPNVIPHDIETADTVFEAMYGEGNAQLIAELSNQYESQEYSSETLVTVEYTENGWNFNTPEDRKMGDPLEGEENLFS